MARKVSRNTSGMEAAFPRRFFVRVEKGRSRRLQTAVRRSLGGGGVGPSYGSAPAWRWGGACQGRRGRQLNGGVRLAVLCSPAECGSPLGTVLLAVALVVLEACDEDPGRSRRHRSA